jgi:hypothetical protein
LWQHILNGVISCQIFNCTQCTKIIDAVWKLIILVSTLYRITGSSGNERVTLWFYNTYSTCVRCVHPWSHSTHPGGSLIRKLQQTKRFLLRSRHFLFVMYLFSICTLKGFRLLDVRSHRFSIWILGTGSFTRKEISRLLPPPNDFSRTPHLSLANESRNYPLDW